MNMNNEYIVCPICNLVLPYEFKYVEWDCYNCNSTYWVAYSDAIFNAFDNLEYIHFYNHFTKEYYKNINSILKIKKIINLKLFL